MMDSDDRRRLFTAALSSSSSSIGIVRVDEQITVAVGSRVDDDEIVRQSGRRRMEEGAVAVDWVFQHVDDDDGSGIFRRRRKDAVDTADAATKGAASAANDAVATAAYTRDADRNRNLERKGISLYLQEMETRTNKKEEI